jgi:hypothetical protein
MKKLLFSLEEISFSPDEIIYEEGDIVDSSFYVIKKGSGKKLIF